MKTKVLFWTMALVAMTFTSCSDDDDTTALTYSLKASPSELTFAATAAEAHDYIVNVLPGNLDTLYNDSMISKITIWDRTPEKVYDSEMDYESPSEALREYWFRPWSDEEYRHITQIVDLLRGKEAQYHLGQSAAIDELERRVQNISSDLEHSFDNLSL